MRNSYPRLTQTMKLFLVSALLFFVCIRTDTDCTCPTDFDSVDMYAPTILQTNYPLSDSMKGEGFILASIIYMSDIVDSPSFQPVEQNENRKRDVEIDESASLTAVANNYTKKSGKTRNEIRPHLTSQAGPSLTNPFYPYPWDITPFCPELYCLIDQSCCRSFLVERLAYFISDCGYASADDTESDTHSLPIPDCLNYL